MYSGVRAWQCVKSAKKHTLTVSRFEKKHARTLSRKTPKQRGKDCTGRCRRFGPCTKVRAVAVSLGFSGSTSVS